MARDEEAASAGTSGAPSEPSSSDSSKQEPTEDLPPYPYEEEDTDPFLYSNGENTNNSAIPRGMTPIEGSAGTNPPFNVATLFQDAMPAENNKTGFVISLSLAYASHDS